jgi:hypothetical protein
MSGTNIPGMIATLWIAGCCSTNGLLFGFISQFAIRARIFAEQLAFILKASRSILEYAEYISPTRFPESAKKRIKRGRKGQCQQRDLI